MNIFFYLKNNYFFILYLTWILILLNYSAYVLGQCPSSTMISFEKISNVAIRGVNLVPLYTGVLEHMPVSAECNNRCRAGPNCRAFIINYSKHSCVGIGYDSESSGISMIATEERTSYFDKICLNVSACEKAWTFERVIGHQLIGFDDRIVTGVVSRLRCEELCLKERQFSCRSGEYDHATLECRLSSQDRRSQNAHFSTTASNIDYFENQCATFIESKNELYNHTSLSNLTNLYFNRENIGKIFNNQGLVSDSFNYNCGFRKHLNLDIQRPDLMRIAHNELQCEQLCEATKAFVCRSFSFKQSVSQCWLNSDDSYSIGGQKALISSKETVYFERSNCINLNLDCRSEAMEIRLNTITPFNGKIYAREDPTRCKTIAKSATLTSLILPIIDKHENNVCGVKADVDGKYSTTVVIQNHPLIQRKGDRMIRLVCNFETSTQVVTNNYQVISYHEQQGSTVVNANASSPEIRLRITDLNGQDVQGTKLGEQLQLRIELKNEDSALDIQATHLIAMSGHTQQQIALIDQNGCPTDANIFPFLEKLPGSKTLVGNFDAFKFADDVVVRFQVNVHFCINRCPPIICTQKTNQFEIDRNSISVEENNLYEEPKKSIESNTYERSSSVTDFQILNEKLLNEKLLNEKLLNEKLLNEKLLNEKLLNENLEKKNLNNTLINNRIKREINFQDKLLLNSNLFKNSNNKKKTKNIFFDAALQREIIVEGLTQAEHDFQAKSLYVKSFNHEYCTSRITIIILVVLFFFIQTTLIVICYMCNFSFKSKPKQKSLFNNQICRQKNLNELLSSNKLSLNQPANCLIPNQINNYFNQIE